MKRKIISPETAKLISTLIVSTIFMVIILSISNMYTDRILEDAKEDYYNSVQSTLNGFSKVISTQINAYKNYLRIYFLDRKIQSYNDEEVFQYLQEIDYSKHEDFLDIYYLKPDGTAFLSDGTITQMSVEKHKSLEPGADIFISGVCYIPARNKYVFVIEKTIYKDGIIAGAFGASIQLEKFTTRTESMKVNARESFFLVDKEGVFLSHKRQEIIGRKYVPVDKRFINTSSMNLAKNPAGSFIGLADDGSSVYLATTKIPESGWTLSIRIPMDEINSIYVPKRRSEVLIVVFAIIIIFLLVYLESKILDFFQKRQLIATVYDPLTNIWTRQRFETEAKKIIRNPRGKYMLIEADIRGFKFINQNYGEESADQLILYYSKILNRYITEFHGIIGHGFADHFYMLVKVTSVHKAIKNFRSKLDTFTEEIKAYEIPFFPKFGISFLLPGDKSKGITIQSLIGQASFAKSTIKDNMLTQYSVYNSKLLEKINEERFIENHMEQALDSHEFFVMYQPKISLSDDKIVGAEALVRWNSPKLGLMTPDKFIPLFERNGFITKLDYYVYEEVFKFIQNSLTKDLPMVPISVNMSRNHNKPEKFMHDFMELFTKYSIPPKMIQVEILERSVMDNSTLQDITDKLHKEGFTVAMDDFGSGESSLNMLTKIPVDVLKFDREFLNASTNNEGRIDKKSEKFIHILINLSKNLEKQTVFEGVETQAQRDFLRSIDCDQAQGFFYSKPLSEQDFLQFIKMHS